MNAYENNKLQEIGFLNEMLARGVQADSAVFFAKQAKLNKLGSLAPDIFEEAFDTEMQKIAAEKRARKVTIIEDNEPEPGDVEEEEYVEETEPAEEPFIDKLKRWGLYAGLLGGGLLAGRASSVVGDRFRTAYKGAKEQARRAAHPEAQ